MNNKDRVMLEELISNHEKLVQVVDQIVTELELDYEEEKEDQKKPWRWVLNDKAE